MKCIYTQLKTDILFLQVGIIISEYVYNKFTMNETILYS
jgi:hypothetical protein